MKRVLFVTLLLLLSTSGAMAASRELQNVTTLDLDTAQRIALADNPSLAAAHERVEQALQQMEQARALYFPRVDLDGAAGWTRLSENSALSQSRQDPLQPDRNQERYGVSLGASWVVFDGFSRKFTNLAAEYGYKGSEFAKRDGQRLLLQLVAESYYNAHLFLYNKQIAEADIAFNKQQLEDAQVRYEQGAGPLSNVLNFEVQINRAKTELLIDNRDYRVALYGLAVLLGSEEARLPESVGLKPLEMIEPSDYYSERVADSLSLSSKYRPDLKQLQARLEQREADIGRARSAYYPTIGLNGSVKGERSEDIYLEEDDFGAAVGMSLSYNLYRGGGDESRIVEARAAKREAIRLYQDQKNQVNKEVRQAYANLELAQEQLDLQRMTTDLVKQTRDLVKDGYDAGQESLVRLNEAQRDLVRTQSNLALALVGLYRFRYNLLTVTGESLSPYYGN